MTASKLRSAICTEHAQSLIKAVCCSESVIFKSRATITYGCEHEDTARSKYKEEIGKIHGSFSLSKSGLIIHVSYPFMGASPDHVNVVDMVF